MYTVQHSVQITYCIALLKSTLKAHIPHVEGHDRVFWTKLRLELQRRAHSDHGAHSTDTMQALTVMPNANQSKVKCQGCIHYNCKFAKQKIQCTLFKNTAVVAIPVKMHWCRDPICIVWTRRPAQGVTRPRSSALTASVQSHCAQSYCIALP